MQNEIIHFLLNWLSGLSVENSKNKTAEGLRVRLFWRLMKSTAKLNLPAAGREMTSLAGLFHGISRQIISKRFIFLISCAILFIIVLGSTPLKTTRKDRGAE